MAESIDRLEVQVEAQATKANNQLDKLVGKLDRVSSALSNLNSGGLATLSDGVAKFSQASAQLSNVKTADFTRLAKNIEKLSNLNTQQLYGASHAMKTLANSMNSFGNVSGNSARVADFASSIGKLGGVNVQRAITNLPALGNAMNNLMTTLSRAPQVSDNIIRMTAALAGLAAQGSKVGTVSNSLTQNINKVGNAMIANTKKAKGFASAIGSLYQRFFWVSRGIDKLWDSIQSSMSYVETLNYFDSAFGQVAKNTVSQWEEAGADSADAYYESFSDRAKELTSKMTGFSVNDDGTLSATGEASLGINPAQLMNYQATFAQMSSSMGVSSETSLMLSQALTEIGADLASVKNMDFDKVWTDMASGLAGMSRTLDKYGVNIRNVNLQQKLFDLGINENITSLNQDDKALLRTIILLESTQYAWGDLADTINQPANQLRLLENNFNNLSRTLGNLFLPMVSKVLPYVNGLAIAIQRLLTWVGSLMGIDLSGITSSIGSSEVDMSELLGDTEDLSGNLDDANNSAKKLKSNLLSIDELNVFSPQDESSAAGTGTGLSSGLLDEAFNEAFSEYQKAWDEAFANMENRAEEFADKVEEYFQPIKDIINDFAIGDYFQAGQDTSNLVSGIFNFFADAIDNVDWYEIGENIGDYFRGIEWVEVLGSIGNLMWQALKASWELYMGALSTAPLETALISLASMPNLLKSITASKFITGFKKLATNAKLLTTALAGNKKSTTVLLQQYPKLGKAVDVARKAFVNFKFGVDNGNFLTGLDNGISTIRNNLTGLQKGAITAIAGLAEFAIISNTFEGLVDGSENLVAGIAKIGGAATIAGVAMYTALGPAGAAIAGVTALVAAVNGINDAFDAIRAEEIGDTIKNAMSNPGGTPLSEITSNFADAFSEASEGFSRIYEKSAEMDSVQRNIEDTWTEIYKIQEAMENGVLSVEEGKAQLETLFSELAILTEQKFSVMNTAILSAYGENGSFRTALDSIGSDTEGAIDAIITYGYQGSARAKEIAQELVGLDINSEEYKKLTAELAALTGEMSSFEKATSDFTYNMNALQGQIDYSEIFLEDGSIDVELLKEYLSQATEAFNEYETSLDEAGKEISQYWQEIYNSPFATEEQKEIARAQLEYIPQAIEEMKSDARLQVISFTDMLQNDFISKTDEIIDDSISDWNNKGTVEKWWNGIWGAGSQGEYVKEAVDQQKKNISEVSTVIDEELAKLGIEGAGWGAEAAERIYGSLFQSEYHYSDMGRGGYQYTLNENYKNIIDEATSDLPGYVEEKGEFIGENTVNGITNGILDNVHCSDDAAEDMALSVIDVTRGSLGINSPSKVFYEIGEYVVQGLINGIESKFLELGNSVSKMSNMVKQGVKSALDIHSPSRVMFELGEYTMQGFKEGMENIYEPIISSLQGFNYEVSVSPSLNTLSYGNFSYANKVTYQNNTKSELGSEVKQAVSETIVEFLQPYLSELVNSNREIANKDLSVAIGDRDIYKASLRGANASGKLIVT